MMPNTAGCGSLGYNDRKRWRLQQVMGWEQLNAMIKENRAQAQRDTNEPPIACPIDGALLDVNQNGIRSCPLGNFRWDGGPVILGT